MNCIVCKAEIPDDSLFCCICGAKLDSMNASLSAKDLPSLEYMLAQANLLRMQAKWEEAENKCIEILRKDPNNYDAHSLLGDIYRDQGRYEDAAQWYQLALDLYPESQKEPEKLAQLRELRTKSQSSIEEESSLALDRTQRLIGITPSVWLKGLTVISVVFMVIVVVFLIKARNNYEYNTKESSSPSPNVSMEPAQPVTPQPAAPRVGMSVQPPQPKQSLVMPSLLPSVMNSQDENRLQSILAQSNVLDSSYSLLGITYDPRTQHATVQLLYNIQNASPFDPSARSLAIHQSLSAAQALFKGDPSLQSLTMEVKCPTSLQTAEPIFIGDIQAAVAIKIPSTSPTGQLLALFNNVWPTYQNTPILPQP